MSGGRFDELVVQPGGVLYQGTIEGPFRGSSMVVPLPPAFWPIEWGLFEVAGSVVDDGVY